MSHAAIGWDSDYGFSRYDAECAADDRFSALVDDMMEEAVWAESWFSDFDLDSEICAEFDEAIAADLKTAKPFKFSTEYTNDKAAGLCEDFADFTTYYAAGNQFHAELASMVSRMWGGTQTHKSLREFCEEELRTRE